MRRAQVSSKTSRETRVTCGKWMAHLQGRSLVLSAAMNARARDRSYSVEKKLIDAGLLIDSRGRTDTTLYMTLKPPREAPREKVLEILRANCRLK